MNIYDFSVLDKDGNSISLEQYRGKVLLIINSATGCFFTPQYEALEQLYEEMKDRDFEILDFPCNQFAGQAPGSNEEIQQFCKARFGVSFPQFAKIDVRGEHADPLFQYLTGCKKVEGHEVNVDSLRLSRGIRQAKKEVCKFHEKVEDKENAIRWNFTKFLVDREGNVVARFEPAESVEAVRREVNHILNGEEVSAHGFFKRKRLEAKSQAEAKLHHQRLNQSGNVFLISFVVFCIYVILITWYLKDTVAVGDIWKILSASLPGAMVLSFGFYFIRKRNERQINELTKALEEATSGNLDYRLNIREKSTLTDAFEDYNEMCEQLKLSMERMEEAVEEAEAANKAKSNFLSNMSHEIRTPLNAVLGMDEMIIRESREEEIRGYAVDIKSAGRSLLSLINDILDLSKIEAQKMEIIPVEYDMSSVINDLLNMTTQKINDKGLELKLKIDATMPHLLYGDEVRIKQVCLNILNNAVKYTDKGSITLSIGYEAVTDSEDIELCFSVKDTGQGIKAEDMDRLFSPFARIQEKRNRNVEGTGLGMSITKNLLEMMGSFLDVDSVYGEGSDFHFKVRQEVRSAEPMGDFAESYHKVMEKQGEYKEAFHAPNAHILVVDDVDMNLTVVKGFLKKTEIKIDTAGCGTDAIELAAGKKYDVIFVDHMMPDMDGFETLAHMREGGASKEVPIIALTANAISGAREQYLAGGFNDYLTKPIDSVKLENMLIKYLPEELVEKDFTVKGRPADLAPEATEKEDPTGLTPEATEKEGSTGLTPEATEEASKEETAADATSDSLTQLAGWDELTDQQKGTAEKLAGTGLDLAAGVQASSDMATYLTVLEDFATTSLSRADQIETYFEQDDWKNYTIQVHALKSSARIAGDLDLSKRAEELEACGNAEDITTIRENTPGLLKDYRRLGQKLQTIFEDSGDKPLIPSEELKDAILSLQDALAVFDMDTADDIMEALRSYRMPEEFAPIYQKCRVLLSEVDCEGLQTLLRENEAGWNRTE